MHSAERLARDFFAKADIEIGGSRAQDIVVHNPEVYECVLADGTLGLGEAYMDGWWDANALDAFFAKATSVDFSTFVLRPAHLFAAFRARLFNRQSVKRAFQVAKEHYDLGNDLYEAMLDRRMIYTCAYYKNAQDLDAAQEAKLDLICRKLGLKAGDRVLDIGCGWGGFAAYAAEKYGAQVVGITVSKEQLALARERTAGLPVELRLQDYRDVHEQFDHIVSVEMFEAVGYKNYRAYFEMVARCLAPGGLFLLQTIGNNNSVRVGDAWIDRYIFPNGMLPSLAQIGKAAERLLVAEDVHNFGADYDPTLLEWFRRFDAAWPALQAKYGERFYRMWKYYLLQCAGMFRARYLQDWQIVFSKGGVEGGYAAVR